VDAAPLPLASLEIVRELSFAAAELPSQIGTVVEGALTPTVPGRPGLLSFGPYIALDPGRYRAVIEYVSANPESEAAGGWQLVAERADGFGELATGSLAGSAGTPSRAEIDFDVPEHVDALQVFTTVRGGADLHLLRITLSAQP